MNEHRSFSRRWAPAKKVAVRLHAKAISIRESFKDGRLMAIFIDGAGVEIERRRAREVKVGYIVLAAPKMEQIAEELNGGLNETFF